MQSENGGFPILGSPAKRYIRRSQGRTRLLIVSPLGGLCSFSFAQIELLSIVPRPSTSSSKIREISSGACFSIHALLLKGCVVNSQQAFV